MERRDAAPQAERLGQTVSLCPECLRQVPAALERAGDDVTLVKTCPRHGTTRTVVWRGPPDYREWREGAGDVGAAAPDCPTLCGPCPDHRQSTCCLLLEVTARCDLGCPVCFAESGSADRSDPSLQEIDGWFAHLAAEAPSCNLQLSGGEPTVRDDLPEILVRGRRRGFSFFQLNTNGLRLAREPGYVRVLAEAGLSTVFLQFDGVDEGPYRALRGAELLTDKLAAVDACAEAGLGVVLVPTLVPGVNTDQIGAIVEFAVARLPAVRGVHLQPMGYFGRWGDGSRDGPGPRITLPEVLRAVVEQTGGRFPLRGFRPAACEHPVCSFHGEFHAAPDGRIVPLRDRPGATEGRPSGAPAVAAERGSGGAPAVTAERGRGRTPAAIEGGRDRAPAAEKARRTAARWSPAPPAGRCCCAAARSRPEEVGSPTEGAPRPDAADEAQARWDRALDDLRGRTFSITAMAFQDAWSVDLERLRLCCLHVLTRDLRRVPFCAYNLTGADGRHLDGRWVGRAARASAAVTRPGA